MNDYILIFYLYGGNFTTLQWDCYCTDYLYSVEGNNDFDS